MSGYGLQENLKERGGWELVLGTYHDYFQTKKAPQ